MYQQKSGIRVKGVGKRNRGHNLNRALKNCQNEKQAKGVITSIREIQGIIMWISAGVSLLFISIIKYMSFGRCLYFDFDMNYFDFSLSAELGFIFLTVFSACIIGTIWGVAQNIVWNMFDFEVIKSNISIYKLEGAENFV